MSYTLSFGNHNLPPLKIFNGPVSNWMEDTISLKRVNVGLP